MLLYMIITVSNNVIDTIPNTLGLYSQLTLALEITKYSEQSFNIYSDSETCEMITVITLSLDICSVCPNLFLRNLFNIIITLHELITHTVI